MLQELPVNKFEWIGDSSQFKDDFMKTIMKKHDEGCFLKADIQYLKKSHELQYDLPFLPKKMKHEYVEKDVTNLHDKTEYNIYIRNSQEALKHGLILKKVQRMIKFNQNSWLKPYIYMSTKLRKKARNDFEKEFSKFMNSKVLGKAMENVKKT